MLNAGHICRFNDKTKTIAYEEAKSAKGACQPFRARAPSTIVFDRRPRTGPVRRQKNYQQNNDEYR
jgi:hypothetical protein